jgi:bile acid:Na+ symporter, BASS family
VNIPVEGLIPNWLLSIVAVATVFTMMFRIGLDVTFGEFRWVWRRPALILKALFAVLIAVPAVALVVARAFGLARVVEIGILLMAIAPGAPVALRRSLRAGGHHAFAPTLQIALAVLAVVSMPLWLAALNEYYVGNASVPPSHLARQVCVAQLLPLGLGMLVRHASSRMASSLGPKIGRAAGVLLFILLVLALIDIAEVVVEAGPRIVAAIALITLGALCAGHLLGGPEPSTRTAVAISSAARNPGLAFVVAALNSAPPEVNATILVYIVISALTVIPYVLWRRCLRSEPRRAA